MDIKVLFSTEISKKKLKCNNHQGSYKMVLSLAYVNSINIYIALSSHLMLVVASLIVRLSMISIFAITMARLSSLCYMWMISSWPIISLSSMINDIKGQLHGSFDITDLGLLFFIGALLGFYFLSLSPGSLATFWDGRLQATELF